MSPPPRPSLSFDAFQSTGYFSALDGLRGISILLVFLHHVPALHDFLPEGLAINGRYGVSLFFIISGYLICSLLLRERDTTGRIDLPRFYGRRALRLLPLYYATLLLQAVLVFGLQQYTPENQALFRDKLPAYLFYYSNWLETASAGPFFCAWSLAVEEQFYLAFGLLMLALAQRWLIWLVASALLTKFVIYTIAGQVDTIGTAWRIAFSYQEAILWGVLLAFALHHRAGYEKIARLFASRWTLPAVVALGLAWLVVHPMESSSTWDAELLYVAMTLVVAGLVTRPAEETFLSRGLLAHLGKISYGIYLLHMLFIAAVRKLPYGDHALVGFGASLVLTVVAATLVYRYFELPIIRYYKRRLSARHPQAATLPLATSTAMPSLATPGTAPLRPLAP